MSKLNKPWFRSFHGTPTDNRFRVIAKKAGSETARAVALWWALNDCASQADERGNVKGFEADAYAEFSNLPESEIAALIAAFTERGMLVDGEVPNWERDQPLEDRTATERKQRQRARDAAAKKAADNDNASDGGAFDDEDNEDLDVTPMSRPVTVMSRSVTTDKIREEEIRSDQMTEYEMRSEETRSDDTRSDKTISDQTKSESDKTREILENDSRLACAGDKSDSPGGERKINSHESGETISLPHGADSVKPDSIPLAYGKISPTPARESNPSTMKEPTLIPANDDDLPDLTKSNLKQIVRGVFGGKLSDAERLVLRHNGDLAPLQAVIGTAMAAPEMARPRAFHYALEDALVAAGRPVDRPIDRWPLEEVNDRDFCVWAAVILDPPPDTNESGHGDFYPKKLLELTGSIPVAMKIVIAANRLPWHEREDFVRHEIERLKFMQDSDSSDDWPRDYKERFWMMYPIQIRQAQAEAELKRLRAQGESFTDIIRGARRYGIESEKTDPKYVKYPDNWLKGGCWSDEWAKACA